MANTACEMLWLLSLLKDLHIDHPHPTVLYCNNEAALHISANSIFHEQTKHTEVDCHLVRDQIQKEY